MSYKPHTKCVSLNGRQMLMPVILLHDGQPHMEMSVSGDWYLLTITV